MTRGKRRLLIFLALSLISLVVMTLQYDASASRPFRMVAYPFDLLNRLSAGIVDAVGEWVSAFEENKRLKDELTRVLIENRNHREVFEENKRLRELLALKEQTHAHLAAAKVVARGYDRFLNTLVLDKGEDAGIAKGMAVITVKGLAGKIHSVREHFSEVLLLRDPNFSAAVRLQEGRAEGVLAGTGEGYCLLKYIPTEVKVKEGEVVVTSGLDGIFPAGIPVGVVSSVQEGGAGFFQEIHITPFQRESTIEEVLVLRQSAAVPVPEQGRQMPALRGK
jgi:rod shape-determining protein MreC